MSFPAIVALGVPPLVANATNTVALWPGAFASLWAYRAEVAGARAWAVRFALPSVLGGATGAVLLLFTPSDRFERVVPFLVLGATVLFMAQGPISRRLRTGALTTMSMCREQRCHRRRRRTCSINSAWASMAATSAPELAS